MTELKVSRMESEPLARACVAICEDLKAKDIVLVDVSASSLLADYYLLCSAMSDPQIRAITSTLQRKLCQHAPCRRVEGTPSSRWMLLDFGVVLIHVLHPEKRSYYRLEELWSEGKIVYRSEADTAAPPARQGQWPSQPLATESAETDAAAEADEAEADNDKPAQNFSADAWSDQA